MKKSNEPRTLTEAHRPKTCPTTTESNQHHSNTWAHHYANTAHNSITAPGLVLSIRV
jgi:hypothetical protein